MKKTGSNWLLIEKIGIDENDLFEPSNSFYISGPDCHFKTANKENFKKYFRGKENELNNYLAKNKIIFNRGMAF